MNEFTIGFIVSAISCTISIINGFLITRYLFKSKIRNRIEELETDLYTWQCIVPPGSETPWMIRKLEARIDELKKLL